MLCHSSSDFWHSGTRDARCVSPLTPPRRCFALGPTLLEKGRFRHPSPTSAYENLGPALIAGDFNQPPDDLCIWPALRTEAHHHAEGILCIPTYKEETKNDTILVSPELGNSIVAVRVRSGFHSVEIPRCTKMWKLRHRSRQCRQVSMMNTSWTRCVKQCPGKVSLEQGSAAAESALNACLARNDQSKPFAKGTRKAPTYKLAKIDFAPPTGGTSVMAKQCARQVRRLESIHRMLLKHDMSHNAIVVGDWNAVRRAKGFIPDFATWAECTLPDYPTVELMSALLERIKTRVTELCNQDLKKKQNLERRSHELRTSWKTQGNHLAHKQSKPQSNPFLNKAKVPETIRVRRIRLPPKGPQTYQIVQEERHQLHHLALPRELKRHDQRTNFFVCNACSLCALGGSRPAHMAAAEWREHVAFQAATHSADGGGGGEWHVCIPCVGHGGSNGHGQARGFAIVFEHSAWWRCCFKHEAKRQKSNEGSGCPPQPCRGSARAVCHGVASDQHALRVDRAARRFFLSLGTQLAHNKQIGVAQSLLSFRVRQSTAKKPWNTSLQDVTLPILEQLFTIVLLRLGPRTPLPPENFALTSAREAAVDNLAEIRALFEARETVRKTFWQAMPKRCTGWEQACCRTILCNIAGHTLWTGLCRRRCLHRCQTELFAAQLPLCSAEHVCPRGCVAPDSLAQPCSSVAIRAAASLLITCSRPSLASRVGAGRCSGEANRAAICAASVGHRNAARGRK